MSILEIAASVLSLISVWLVAKEKIWCWPTGIVSVFIYTWIFYQTKLYSDALLQLAFAAMQIFGWINWQKNTSLQFDLNIRSIKKAEISAGLVFIALTSVILGWLMFNYTNADFSFLDAACTAISLFAQFLLSRKIIQSWLLWILVDVIYVFIYFQKGLYPTAFLYTLFVVMAILGYINWKNRMQQKSNNSY
jgi:nicotinamide mononucleotide transporter